MSFAKPLKKKGLSKYMPDKQHEMTQPELTKAVTYALAYLRDAREKLTANTSNDPDLRRSCAVRVKEIEKEIKEYETYLEQAD